MTNIKTTGKTVDELRKLAQTETTNMVVKEPIEPMKKIRGPIVKANSSDVNDVFDFIEQKQISKEEKRNICSQLYSKYRK